MGTFCLPIAPSAARYICSVRRFNVYFGTHELVCLLCSTIYSLYDFISSRCFHSLRINTNARVFKPTLFFVVVVTATQATSAELDL